MRRAVAARAATSAPAAVLAPPAHADPTGWAVGFDLSDRAQRPRSPSIDPGPVSDTRAIVGVAREDGNDSARGRPVIWRQFSG